MAEVAAAADVSQGLAYRYFAGKDELVRALVAEALRSDRDARLVQTSGTPGERLRRLLTAILEARRDHPEVFQLIDHVLEDEDAPADLVSECHRRGRWFVQTLRELVVAGQATGEVVPGDPDQLVWAVIACFEGLSRLRLRHPEHGCAHFPSADVVLRLVMRPRSEASPAC